MTYTITLSDGTTHFSVYDLEQDGPNNTSTPRHIKRVVLNGGAGSNYFEVIGNLAYRFVAGFTFTVSDSTNAGSYTVAPAGASYVASYNVTRIPVTQTINSDRPPYGSFSYSISPSTALLLSGQGAMNYAPAIAQSLVHKVENFARPSAPQYPIKGMRWYNTSNSTLQVWTGSAFTGDIVVGSPGGIYFRDPQNTSGSPQLTHVTMTGAETTYPDVGVSIKSSVNSSSASSIFRVLSSTNDTALRVEYDGHVTTTGAFKQTSTTLNNEFANDIVFTSTKGIKPSAVESIAEIVVNLTGQGWAGAGGFTIDSTLYIVTAITTNVGINTPNPSTSHMFHVTGKSTINGILNLYSGTANIINVSTPINSTDAATKGYVDTQTVQLSFRNPVRLATTTTLSSYTTSGTGVGKTITAVANGALSVDGTLVATNDRILVKNETSTNARNNGIYTVTNTGGISAPFVLTRATDMDQNTEVTTGSMVIVQAGSTLIDTIWLLTTIEPITVDTTSLTFVRFGGPTTLNYSLQSGTGSASYTTPFTFTATAGGKQYLQVFVNGILSIEGKNYTTVAPNTVTFTSIPTVGADVEFYGFG